MRKLALVLAIALAFGAMARANDIAFYVGNPNVDGWYDLTTMNKDVDTIVAKVGNLFKDVQRFDDKHLKELADWVTKNTNDGELDILWLNGTVPSSLYPLGNAKPDGSVIEAWLDGGNMIINVSDWFGYCSYEGGSRQTDNGSAGAANILDLNAGIITGADNTTLTVTAAGKLYIPSLGNTMVTYRPVVPAQVVAPWEVAEVFAQNSAGTYADPIVIHNKTTGAYVAFINQTAGGVSTWIDRGVATSEFIENWVNEKVGLGPQPRARVINPPNGYMISKTSVQASWKAGDYAKLHDVFFGESAEAVAAATTADTAIYVGRQATTQLVMGMAGGVVPGGLVPGKTYYWRVDELNDTNPASPWKGNVWSFQVQPVTAWKPTPPDGWRNIDPNQDLAWEKGMDTIFHTVYFGTSFDAVNTGTMGMMTAAPTYEPGTLALSTTYYWRVDEFAFPANKTFKGPIWSFSTRGPGGGAEAQYFNGIDLAGDPIVTRIEGSINHRWAGGEVAGGLADLVSARWKGVIEAPSTETYSIIATGDDGIRLWLDGRLVVGNGWVLQAATDYTYKLNAIKGQVYSIVLEFYENTGDAVAELSWQSASVPRQVIPQGWLQLPGPATCPYPANGALHAPQTAKLSWIAGPKATSQELYFGEDKAAVEGGIAPTATLGADETTYDPGALEGGKTYYWRVDEVNPAEAGSPWKGVTWSFTVADFLVVDDFESYTDEVGQRLFQTWVDGLGYTEPEEVAGNGSGSTVGNWPPPVSELSTVYSDFQSMPMDYNNAVEPYYSEADRTWTAPQNWTANGLNTLVVHARSSNVETVKALYVRLEDSTGKSAVVPFDTAITVKANTWVEWPIALSKFTGVNAGKIKKMSVGVGNRTAPAKGDAGRVYIDDIWVIKQ